MLLTFDDELPEDMAANGGARFRFVMSHLLTEPNHVWWDDAKTPGVVEGRGAILSQAMVDAREDLTRRLGKDPKDWQWGELHTWTPTHPVLGGDNVPGIVRWAFNDDPVPLGGGSAIVNANGWDASKGYAVTWAPSMRMVVDLADLDASVWINQTGASGHPLSDHYTDQVADWAAGRNRPWPFTARAVAAATEDTWSWPSQLTLSDGVGGALSRLRHHVRPSAVTTPSTTSSWAARGADRRELARVKHDDDLDAGRAPGQCAVVTATSLAESRSLAIDGQAGGQHECCIADGVVSQGSSCWIGDIRPVEVEIRQGDRHDDAQSARGERRCRGRGRWLDGQRLIEGDGVAGSHALGVEQVGDRCGERGVVCVPIARRGDLAPTLAPVGTLHLLGPRRGHALHEGPSYGCRMMRSVEEHLAAVLSLATPLPVETVAVSEARGRSSPPRRSRSWTCRPSTTPPWMGMPCARRRPGRRCPGRGGGRHRGRRHPPAQPAARRRDADHDRSAAARGCGRDRAGRGQ